MKIKLQRNCMISEPKNSTTGYKNQIIENRFVLHDFTGLCWRNIGYLKKWSYKIYQSQQEIHKSNISRKQSVEVICNPYNSHCWPKPESYAQFTNEKPKQVKFNRSLYSIYSQKWYHNEKGDEKSPWDTKKSPQ